MPVRISNGARIKRVIWFRDLFSIAVHAGLSVGFVDQLDWVANVQVQTGEPCAGADVHLASGIARCEYCSVCFAHVVQLLLEDTSGQLGLQKIVNSGGAATSVGAFEWNEIC